MQHNGISKKRKKTNFVVSQKASTACARDAPFAIFTLIRNLLGNATNKSCLNWTPPHFKTQTATSPQYATALDTPTFQNTNSNVSTICNSSQWIPPPHFKTPTAVSPQYATVHTGFSKGTLFILRLLNNSRQAGTCPPQEGGSAGAVQCVQGVQYNVSLICKGTNILLYDCHWRDNNTVGTTCSTQQYNTFKLSLILYRI